MTDTDREALKHYYKRAFENQFLEQSLGDTSAVGRVSVLLDDYVPREGTPTELTEEVTE